MFLRNYQFQVDLSIRVDKVGGIHKAYELLYISDGQFLVNWLGRIFPLDQGTLIMFTPNTPHYLSSLSAKGSYWYLEIEALESEHPMLQLTSILEWNLAQSLKDVIAPECLQPTLDNIQNAIRTQPHERQPYFEDILLLDTQRLMFQMLGMIPSTSKPLQKANNTELDQTSMDKQKAKWLVYYMEANFHKDISITSLADLVKWKSREVIQKFHTVIGKTPYQYLLALRLEAAKSYLATTTMSIQLIAEATGFPNIHHFSLSFKQKTGLSPTDWRHSNSRANI